MRKLILPFLFFVFYSTCSFGQVNYRIDNSETPWENGKDGYVCLDIPATNDSATLPEEFKNLKYFSIFNVPFQIKPETAGKCATSKEGTEEIILVPPKGTREILFVLYADFPKEEIGRSWELPTPVNILSEPERALITLVYSDGETDEIMPVNADFKGYGITHGRALYSVSATKGKMISKMIFKDKMRNASFQILAATANQRLMQRVAEPLNDNLWYSLEEKVALSGSSFTFNTKNGFAWSKIESEMLPKSIDLNAQPVFMIVYNNINIPSTEWTVSNIRNKDDTIYYTIIYNKDDLNLSAILKSFKSKRNEISLSLEITNLGNQAINAQLFFPMISNLKIGSVTNTWYAYARNGLIVNKMNCSYRDYLGCEKALQFDGIFNPEAGVGIGIFPRDTTDFFRYYNFSKDDGGINYALEYAPVTKKSGDTWKSVPVTIAVIPGDWKDQFASYKDWVSTWYKKTTPVLDWFNQTFAFAYFDNNPEGSHDFIKGAMEFKERFGYIDYLHIFGWANTRKYGHWGDYSHYESVGNKKEFASNIKKLQKEFNIPVGLYLDGYLITDKSELLPKEKKLAWSVKQPDGTPYRDYNSFVECQYVKGWQDYLISRFKEVNQITGAKGMYCDELGMSLRARVCYDTLHGHPIPYYMASSENEIMKGIKAALPDVAIYNEYGGTDVMTQFNDGGLTYVTSWNSYSPEWFNVTGNIPYNEIAPQYLDIRRFAFPEFKTFDVILTQVPWKDGNWSLGKFPFFNGNSYFHRVDEGKDGDEEALKMFRTIRSLQNEYKLEFSSKDVEPFVTTLYPNIFANRFSTSTRDVYTLFNANFRTANGILLKVRYKPGSRYKDVWNNRELEISEIKDGLAALRIEIGPRSVICVVRFDQ